MDLIARFKNSANIIEVQPDNNVFTKGEHGDEMFVMLEGIVALYVGYDVIDIIEAGEVLGEMAIIDSQVRSATAVAKTPSKLVSINREQFLALVKEEPDFSIYLMTVLAERLRKMNTHIEQRTYQ